MNPEDPAIPGEPVRWPKPAYDVEVEPLFLFIITPPSSGSTALAKIICTSRHAMLLHRKGEGQWLLPGLCEGDRWDSDKYVDYDSVKAVWLAAYQQRWRENKALEVVVEKSPPNLVRLHALINHFKKHTLLANNRDPFANCASRLYRKNDTGNMGPAQRIEAIQSLLRSWLAMSRQIRQMVLDLDIPLLTYEEFCRDPALSLRKTSLPDTVIRDINVRAKVRVKDYDQSRIINKNTEQINRLCPEEIACIANGLQREEELLAFFGYSADIPSDYAHA